MSSHGHQTALRYTMLSRRYIHRRWLHMGLRLSVSMHIGRRAVHHRLSRQWSAHAVVSTRSGIAHAHHGRLSCHSTSVIRRLHRAVRLIRDAATVRLDCACCQQWLTLGLALPLTRAVHRGHSRSRLSLLLRSKHVSVADTSSRMSAVKGRNQEAALEEISCVLIVLNQLTVRHQFTGSSGNLLLNHVTVCVQWLTLTKRCMSIRS